MAALMLAAMMASLAVSCGKDPEGGQNHDNKADTQASRSGEQLLAEIIDFGKLLESCSNGEAGRETRYMAVSEAVVNIESLFNYTFANPDLCYGHTVALDTTLYMLVTPDDSVSVAVLADFYGRMHNAVRALYQSVGLPDKCFLILDVQEEERLNGKWSILLHTVQGSLTSIPPHNGDTLQPDPGPFPVGVSWYYGEKGGSSNSLHVGELDAADTLAMVINNRLFVAPPAGMSFFYHNIRTPVSSGFYPFSYGMYPDEGPYSEFYKESPAPGDYWLDSDQMNFHYFGEMSLARYVLPNVGDNPVPAGHVLFHVDIEAQSVTQGGNPVIKHQTTAKYGMRELVDEYHSHRDP